jgi:non-ribosomal peptide synthase protein (TIGR01720 family)
MRRVDIADLGEEARQDCIRRESDEVRGRLDPEDGVMVQAVWFDAGGKEPGGLLLAVHHLVVDGVSWRILIPDLKVAWEGIAGKREVELEPCFTSFRQWAEQLSVAAKTSGREAELPVWEEILRCPDPLLSDRPLNAVLDTAGKARSLRMRLPSELTAPLLGPIPALFHGGINDVLLSAFAIAVAKWRQGRGLGMQCAVLVDLEGHGREELFEGMDLSRTIGWFTSLFPVRLDPGALDLEDAMAGDDSLGRAVKRIKEQLRGLPDHGVGYGQLRYLNPATGAILEKMARPQIGFNYLGRFSTPVAQNWEPVAQAGGLGGGTEEEMPLAHAIELNAVTHDGMNGSELLAHWTWAGELFRETEIRDLAEHWFQTLGALVSYTAQPNAGGRTPTDVQLVTLTQKEIEHIEAVQPFLADILPLSPLQEGLLFHALYDEQGPDVYAVQLVLNLEGAFDEGRMKEAVGSLLKRHTNLRAGFLHRELEVPVQVIPREVTVPWESIDLSFLDVGEGEQRLQELLAEDWVQRFDLAQPPLLRFKLIRLATDRHQLVFTHHHILLDGWSMPVLLQELSVLYESGGDDTKLSRVTPYREYLGWLKKQDGAQARAAWQEALAGLEEGTRIAPSKPTRTVIPETFTLELSEEFTVEVSREARRHGLTLNTVVQGVWGILLGELSGREDVVFGVTVAGRPPELAGVEGMVGLFINTVPARLQLHPTEKLSAVLKRLQEQQAVLLAHQHLALPEIQRLAGVGELFDTLFVFENYPVDRDMLGGLAGKIRISGGRGGDISHYPLALAVIPGRRLQLRLGYRPDLFERSSVEAMGKRLQRLLEAVAQDPEQRIGNVDLLDASERHQIVEEWNETAHEVAGTTVVELFEEQVEKSPDAVAVVFEEERLSYAELNGRANRLAHYLMEQGAGPEGVVGICLERSVEMVVSLLGILKAGAAYLPLDPEYPAERLRFMVEDARPVLIVSSTGAVERLPESGGYLLLDETKVQRELAAHSPMNPRDGERKQPLRPQNPAYVIYTSGSTGKPKGVVVEHRGFTNLLHWFIGEFRLSSEDHVMLISSISFDLTQKDIFAPLLLGGKLHIPERKSHVSEVILRDIALQGITTVNCAPSVLYNLIDTTQDHE